MYTRLEASTGWNNHYSEYFSVQNGICQGGIINRLLYTVYADKLIHRLELEGIGCHISSKYYGAICYADDMQILYPSVCGLQSMINICVEYGIEYDITYNEMISICMVFKRRKYNQNNNINIYLNGAKLECVQKAKHLGMWFTPDMDNSKELIEKKGNFIGQVNHILMKYGQMYSPMKCKTVEAYFCHFYGSEIWDFSNCNFNSVLNSWNISIRKAYNLPYMTH